MKETEIHRFEPDAVFKDGKEIFWKGEAKLTLIAYHFPEEFYHSVHLDKIEAKDLEPVVSTDQKQVQVRVIEVADGRTQTKEKLVSMEVENNRLKWQDSGCMLAACWNAWKERQYRLLAL